jgi:hypothetical protein
MTRKGSKGSLRKKDVLRGATITIGVPVLLLVFVPVLRIGWNWPRFAFAGVRSLGCWSVEWSVESARLGEFFLGRRRAFRQLEVGFEVTRALKDGSVRRKRNETHRRKGLTSDSVNAIPLYS